MKVIHVSKKVTERPTGRVARATQAATQQAVQAKASARELAVFSSNGNGHNPTTEEPEWLREVVLTSPVDAQIGNVVFADTSLVDPDPCQPRTEFIQQTLEDMADSIRKDGQEEICHAFVEDGRYQLVNGERRLRACLLAKVPVRLLIIKEPRNRLRTLIEQTLSNDNHEELSPLDQARLIQDLLDLGASMKDVIRVTGKSQSWIYNYQRILTLDPEVQKMMALSVPEKTRLGVFSAVEVAKAPRSKQLMYAQQIVGMNIGKARRHIRAELGIDQRASDFTGSRPRKPSDDRTMFEHFLCRVADDAVAYAEMGQYVIDHMFANMPPATRAIALAKAQRATNNLDILQKMLKNDPEGGTKQ